MTTTAIVNRPVAFFTRVNSVLSIGQKVPSGLAFFLGAILQRRDSTATACSRDAVALDSDNPLLTGDAACDDLLRRGVPGRYDGKSLASSLRGSEGPNAGDGRRENTNNMKASKRVSSFFLSQRLSSFT